MLKADERYADAETHAIVLSEGPFSLRLIMQETGATFWRSAMDE